MRLSSPRHTCCPRCDAAETTQATKLSERFAYLRCGTCTYAWSISERRLTRRITLTRRQGDSLAVLAVSPIAGGG